MINFLTLGQMAVIFAVGLLASIALTALTLWVMRRSGLRQQVREDTPSGHQEKQGTPSMGGVAIIGAVWLGAWVGGVFSHSPDEVLAEVLAILAVMLVFGALGFADDYLKLIRQTSTGIKARYRLCIEFIVALAVVWLVATRLSVPGTGIIVLGFGSLPVLVRIALAAFVVVGSANAVNLSDGLDGLAAGLVAVCATALSVVCWMVDQPGLALLSALLAGITAGFLWFNAHPAQIFMGDVGSLSLGAALGGIAVMAEMELLFAVLAGVFVIETVSVIIQVIWFQTTGRRVFLMTPIHHSLELRGWSEPQIVTRLWLSGALCAAVGLIITASVVS